MQLGLNTYTLRGLERAEAFALARELGLEAVELWAGHASYLRVGVDPRRVAEEARAMGVRLHAYCIGGLFGLRDAVVEERLARATAFARGLGVDLLTCILDRAAVPIAEARARRSGVRIALENHWYTELARPADFAVALAGLPAAVGVAIDTGHFAYLGCDLAAVARQLGPRTHHVHLKAVRRPGRGERLVARVRRRHHMAPAIPGPGDQLDAFAAALASTGYDGMLAIEHEAPVAAAADLLAYAPRVAGVLGRRLRAAAGREPASV